MSPLVLFLIAASAGRAARSGGRCSRSAGVAASCCDFPSQATATPIRTLEALLPTSLGGVALTVESQAGTELVDAAAPPSMRFSPSLGKTRADFTLASAYSQGELKAEVGAWRVKGADPALLLPGFKTAVQASSTTPLTAGRGDRRRAARSRASAIPGQLTRGPLYVVVRGDTLLFVQTPEPRARRGGDGASCRQ